MGLEKNQHQTSLLIGHFILVLLAGHLSALTPSCSPPSCVKETSFKLLPLNDALLTHDVLQNVASRSRIECSKQCAQTAGCIMSTFHGSAEGPPARCRLFRTVHGQEAHRVTSTGARSYAVAGACPGRFELQCERCLKLVTEHVNYTYAKQRCELEGAQLSMLKTRKDVDCVINFINVKGVWYNYTWVGADDLALSGQYLWADGTVVPKDSAVWETDFPGVSSFSRQLCVHMRYGNAGRGLGTGYCVDTIFYLCEADRV